MLPGPALENFCAMGGRMASRTLEGDKANLLKLVEDGNDAED